MQRKPMIYAAAGAIFGFVVGYAAANANRTPAPRLSTFPSADESVMPPAATPGTNLRAVDPDEVRALQALARREPRNAEARVRLGNVLMDAHQYEVAARWYREALAAEPKRPDVVVDLGACLVNSGRPAEGLAEFDRALRMDPTHRNAAFNRGVALVELDRPKEAADTWEALLSRFPDDPQLQALRSRIADLRAAR